MNIYSYAFYFLYFLIGALSGVFMGVIGVGAGMITIPLLIYSGLNIKQSVGISLIMQLLPQSLPGVLMYYKEKYITYKIMFIAMMVVIGSFFGIYFGSFLVLNKLVNEDISYIILSLLLIFSGIYIMYEHVLYKDYMVT
jgi:hypothetical protein|tara:strand:- start:139 stop:555 length:417 start_codon:yes stop_codon:yes gene_type:complete